MKTPPSQQTGSERRAGGYRGPGRYRTREPSSWHQHRPEDNRYVCGEGRPWLWSPSPGSCRRRWEASRTPTQWRPGNRGGGVFVDRGRDLDADLERLYTRYLSRDLDASALDGRCAAGLVHFLTLGFESVQAVKGQIIGPLSFGLTVTDQDRRAVLYDDVLADAVAKHLNLQAAWQERELRRLAPRTIIFVDEPYLAAFGRPPE